MSWRDQMRPASFRGVPFYVRNTTDRGGRLATVLKAFSSEAGTGIPDDSGAMADVFAIDAFVGGDDYLADLEALETALKTKGPGELVHPFRGSRRVTIVGGFETRQNAIDEGGIAHVRFTAKRVGTEGAGLRVRPLPALGVESAVSAVASAASSDFADAFDVDDLPEAYQASPVDALEAAGVLLASMEEQILSAADTATDALSAAADLGTTAGSLLGAPSSLAATFAGAVGEVFAAAESAASEADALRTTDVEAWVTRLRGLSRTVMRGAEALFDAPELVPASNPVTANRTREADNMRALQSLVRAHVAAEAARATTYLPYSSRSESLTALDDLLSLFDRTERTASDDTFRALMQLRGESSRYLRELARGLPEVANLNLPGETHAFLLAHELYGDARRAEELVARNGLVHSGLIPAGTPLEVLRE